jgi:PAS domain S-box-containing protein
MCGSSEAMIPDMVQLGCRDKDPYRRLAEINRAITTSLDFDQVLNRIVENAAQLVNANVSLLLLTDEDQRVSIRASLGIEQNLVSAFSGRMEEDLIRGLKRHLGLAANQQLISVPIIAKNALNGLLVIARETPLSPEEHWQLSALADQAAIALRNARLYEMELTEANRERDQTLDALQVANARATRILESITDLFYQLDRDWRFIDVNRQTEIHFGKTRAEMLGRVIWDLFPQAVDSPLYSMFHEAVDEMVAKDFEFPSNIVPGTWFEAHAYPSGSGLTVYLGDITERKQSEVTRLLLSSIVESSDDAIVSKDLNGTILSWNAGAERLFGYKADEVIGKSITIIIPQDRRNEEPAILEKIVSGGSVDHYQTVRQRKDGSLIDISVTVSPVKDEQGKIVGASKIAREITAQRKALEEIAFQARLLNAVEQAVIATDLEGKVIYWNDFAEGLYGWSAEEALGSNIFDLTPAADSQPKAAEIFETLKAGKSWTGELLLKRRDGSTFPAIITDSPITNDKNQLIGIVGVSVDITDEKVAEEERKKLLARAQSARAEAEAANRLKDEFLATLSHELRNPLNVVIGYSEILRRSDGAQNEGFVAKAAEVIRRNALAQTQLVSDLLDLSRLQTGKLAINRQPVSLTTIAQDAIETVRAEAEVKNISLNLADSSDTFVVDGDPVRLGQIVWNLLNNAVKFTPAGGTITISLTRQDRGACFVIEDTGQGIVPEFLPHVFEIFRQADASSSRRLGGLGIGLALVKQLAELHGGHIKAESEGSGRGARFSVWLPVQNFDASEPEVKMTGNAGVLKRKFILVVDDSRETTEMLSRLLQMEGAFVWTARSGVEALELAEGKIFDLIITDISMPEMDGYQLLHKLRELPPMADVPALALTGYGRSSDVDRANREGFARHFTKPLDIDKLLQTVKELTTH